MEPVIKHNKLFLGSGCLTAEGLRLYVGGQLNQAEVKRAESHLEDCKFCASAVSGTFEYRKTKSDSDLTKLHEQMSADIAQMIDRKKKQVSPSVKTSFSPYTLWFSVAASVLLMIGLFFAYQNMDNDTAEQDLAVLAPKPPASNVNPGIVDKPKMPPAANQVAPSSGISSQTDAVVANSKEEKQQSGKISEPSSGTAAKEESPAVAVRTPFLGNPESKTSAASENDELVDIAQSKETQVEPSAREVVTSVKKRATKSPAGKIFDESENTIFTMVEEMPSFPGGEAARVKFLKDHVNYPEVARESGIAGTVFVSFVVEANGKITNVKVAKGIGGGCDEEAVRVTKKMPDWIPGKQVGKPVRVQFVMTIKFNSR